MQEAAVLLERDRPQKSTPLGLIFSRDMIPLM
jgi:hypothetical protein